MELLQVRKDVTSTLTGLANPHEVFTDEAHADKALGVKCQLLRTFSFCVPKHWEVMPLLGLCERLSVLLSPVHSKNTVSTVDSAIGELVHAFLDSLQIF